MVEGVELMGDEAAGFISRADVAAAAVEAALLPAAANCTFEVYDAVRTTLPPRRLSINKSTNREEVLGLSVKKKVSPRDERVDRDH
eukprot:333538-Prorocentrum_minimum.AAC.4